MRSVLFLSVAIAALGQQCSISDSQKFDCYPWGPVDQTKCLAHGCCWNPSSNPGVAWCYYPQITAPTSAACAAVTVPSRIDCHPEPNADQNSCEARGCCWSPVPSSKTSSNATSPAAGRGSVGSEGIAACFFPHTDGYTAGTPTTASNGFTAPIQLGAQSGPYRNDITPLTLSVEYRTQDTLRFTIQDPNSSRWVPPVPLQPAPPNPPATTDYAVSITQAPEPFGITVTRASTGAVLFDSRVVASSASRASSSASSSNAQAAPAASGIVNNGLIFEDQYLELSTMLPVGVPGANGTGSVHIYGLAEHINPLQLQSDGQAGQIYTMLARDQGTPVHASGGNTNLYASQPFYMVLDPTTGEAFGVFLFNSNGMDILLQQGTDAATGAPAASVTYRVIGGVFDYYIFTGPAPQQVVQQYQALVGTPRMPPRWALGFHLCRWGYGSLNQTQAIWQDMLDKQMPQDVQWNDIDYMNNHLDFTTDPALFPTATMAEWIQTLLTKTGQKYIQIIDPGISSTQTPGSYPPWDEGVQQRIFINNSDGDILVGKVWPGLVGFPDFFHPNATAWWQAQFQRYNESGIVLSGAWIDMNEVSNFCDGQCTSVSASSPSAPHPTPLPAAPKGAHRSLATASKPVGPGFASRSAASKGAVRASQASYGRGAVSQGAFPGDPQFPPYLPGRLGGATLLEVKTVSMNATQVVGLHYNAHNLYGWSEGVATVTALENIHNKRGFVVSRSTFASSGHYVNHWLGDNEATWDDLYYNLPGVLSFNMIGVPMVGADVCGFGGSATTPELCTRWQQLGAFINGFYRNHNTIGKQEQAPSTFDDPYRSYMRDALNARLALTPYLYTLFHVAHAIGDTVTRPVFFEFPTDPQVAALDTQAMLGPALLVSPVLQQGATTKTAYFPAALWYDYFTGALLNNATGVVVPGWNTIPAPLSSIPVHLRGGYIVPTQAPNMTTTFSAVNPFTITIALNESGMAAGSMFYDDGESIGTWENGAYSYVQWTVDASANSARSAGKISTQVVASAYSPPSTATLQTIVIYGVQAFSAKGSATVNGAPATVAYNAGTDVLTITTGASGASIVGSLSVSWSG